MYLTEYSLSTVSKFLKQSERSSLSFYVYHFAGSFVFRASIITPKTRYYADAWVSHTVRLLRMISCIKRMQTKYFATKRFAIVVYLRNSQKLFAKIL